ncbi:MAG: zinc ABC transporter substrate-binding protein [Bradymonadales bacterium]|nr:MAG: zinc ABC transporter substrate-binding protein [Bradymonadales bacterium]
MIFKIFISALFALGSLTAFSPSVKASAPLQVVTSIPDFAWLIQRLGGDSVIVQPLLRGTEDPHFVDAVPSHILMASRADLFCFVGLELEVGWVPRVIERSRNSKIKVGSPGHCDLGNFVQPLDPIDGPIDRSMGHLHASGNPHYWLSPTIMGDLAQVVAQKLSELRPQNRDSFVEAANGLRKELQELAKRQAQRLQGQNLKILEYHAEFSYLIESLGLERLPYEIEEKPGVPPSASALYDRIQRAKRDEVRLVLASPSSPHRLLRRFSKESGIPVLRLPTMTTEGDYQRFYRGLVDQILEHSQGSSS